MRVIFTRLLATIHVCTNCGALFVRTLSNNLACPKCPSWTPISLGEYLKGPFVNQKGKTQ